MSENNITYTVAQKVKGSCTKGHKWEYDPMKIGDIQPTLQIANGKTWCLLCIEEAMVWLAIGEVEVKPPNCKLCRKAHWMDEEHAATSALEEVRELGASVLNPDALPAIPVETIPVRVRATVVDFVPAPPSDVPTTCGCGKPREGRYKLCAACRKRAYRGRRSR